MDNTEQLISIYHTGFIVCAILLVVGIAMAILFFFMFDIRNIFLLRTGRAKQQTISEMQERNLKTGKLSTDSPYTESGELKPKEKKRNTGAFRIPGRKGAVVEPPAEQPLAASSMVTEQIGPMAPAGPAAAPAASAASAAAMETSVLDGAGNMQAREPAFSAAAASAPGPGYNAPLETSVLTGPAQGYAAPASSNDFRFEITERTIVTHTRETIS